MKSQLINYERIESLRACEPGSAWFVEKYGKENDVEYQSVLNELVKCEKYDWAEWLMEKIGRENTILEIEGDLEKTAVYFAGSIKVKGSIKVSLKLSVGGTIEAGGAIRAGGTIEAGGAIEAGWGFGIFAGLRIRLNDQITNAIVTAKTKPENLVSGHFVEKQ